MTINYTWKFPVLDAYPEYAGETDVVFTVHYRLIGADDSNHVGSVYGTVSVTYHSGSSFTPFAQLTKEQVQSWVEESLGQDRVTDMKSNIDAQIQEQINPTSVTLPPPWE